MTTIRRIPDKFDRSDLDNLEVDLHRLWVNELKHLSKLLLEIEKPVSASITAKLEDYKTSIPDSPLLSEATLFGPIEYGRLEIATSRALAWLMDPNQSHGFDCGVTKLMMKCLGKTSSKRAVKSVTSVIPEKHTSKGKRVDIWAEGKWSDGKSWTLLVEVKIDASESSNQLSNYEREAPKNTRWFGIFLTPEGEEPITNKYHNWESLSFHELASGLTSYYLKVRKRPGADFLRLFTAGLLRDVLKRPVPVSVYQNNAFEIADLIVRPS